MKVKIARRPSNMYLLSQIYYCFAVRLSGLSSLTNDCEIEGKDLESSREQIEFSRRFEKENSECHKTCHDHDDGRLESEVEESQKRHSHSSNSSSRHLTEKGLRSEQKKQSVLRRSPTLHEQHYLGAHIYWFFFFIEMT